MTKRTTNQFKWHFPLFGIVMAFSCLCLMYSCKKDKRNIAQYDFTPSGVIDNYEYVDLGLSVKWATCNLGASAIEASGEYYAWQETTPVTPLTPTNYNYRFDPCSPNHILSSIYDAATANMGENWRMPTWDEMEELCKNCKWTWTDDFQNSGVSGCIIHSNITQKSIFLPAAGYINLSNQHVETDEGFYWSSYILGDPAGGLLPNRSAMALAFFYGNITYGGHSETCDRAAGVPVRPVVGSPNNYIPEGPFPLDETLTNAQGYSVSGVKEGMTYVDMGLPSRTLWATYNVGANKPREYGNFYAWGEIAPKQTYFYTTYAFYDGTHISGGHTWNRYNKYTWFEGHHGPVDGKLILEPQDDAATQNIGPSWSMPTKAQFEELLKYSYTMEDGGSGWIFISKINGYTLHLPNGGWEYSTYPNNHFVPWYWTCQLMEPNPNNTDYEAYYFTQSTSGFLVSDTDRVQGLSVRGVTKY